MNEDVYLRENYKDQYDKHEFLKYGEKQYKTEENEKYTYFVDCTTGEIIGGDRWNVFDNEKIRQEEE